MKLFDKFKKKHASEEIATNHIKETNQTSNGANPIGGAFFIPVNQVTNVPMGQHIVVDFITSASSLSHDFTYAQSDLASCLKQGLSFPPEALMCNGKQYPLVSGGISSDRIFVNVNGNQKAIICFRSIGQILSSPICQGAWISMGTLSDVIGNEATDFVIIDPGYPSQTVLPISVVNQVLNAK